MHLITITKLMHLITITKFMHLVANCVNNPNNTYNYVPYASYYYY
jgi:hypothetical protein